MKTINSLKTDRKRLVSQIVKIKDKPTLGDNDKKVIKKCSDEIKLIDLCVRYLETTPSEAFVKTSIADIKQKIKVHEERFGVWDWMPPTEIKRKDLSKRLAYYRRECGIPHLKRQVKTLSYLLA